MTSELKCPVCGHKLALETEYEDKLLETMYCPTCKHFMLGNYRIWQALIQAKQDLEIATKALEETQHWLGAVRRSMISHLNNQNNTLFEHYETDPTVQNIDKAKRILKHYIKQMTTENKGNQNEQQTSYQKQ